MKKRLRTFLLMAVILMMAGCGNSNSGEELADMATLSEDGYTAIVWDENIYVPYCAIQKNNCGQQIGFVDGDKNDRVYEYEGYSTGEWIINMYESGLMDNAMLYREINVADIPDGLVSEYEWNNLSAEGVSDYPAAFMANDTIYLIGEVPMPAEVDDSAIIGYTESFTDTFPENNGETNFNPELGMPFAQVEGGIAILFQNEWYLGTPFSNAAGENTITFDGVIIDHTLESLVPVICVKVLNEEVIPYETVFFELPDDEAEWALQTNVLVNITCDGAFTEQAPYFGTLISITGLTTDADNSLISVVNLWGREDVARLSSEDAAVIATLFEGGSWREGASDCANDCLLIMDDDEIQYHSDCGTFNDEVNEKSLQLTEKQQVEVNAILGEYIALGMDGIEE